MTRRVYWIVELRAKGTRAWDFDSAFTARRAAEEYLAFHLRWPNAPSPSRESSFEGRVIKYIPVAPATGSRARA